MKYLNFATPGSLGSPGTRGSTTGRGLPERLIIAIDCSPSMEYDDWPPTRLEAAKEAANALIRRKARIAPDDQVGLVSYARRAVAICRPMLASQSEAHLCRAIDRMSLGEATCISAGLVAAGKQLELGGDRRSWLMRLIIEAPSSNGKYVDRIVLLTDGHHNSGQ